MSVDFGELNYFIPYPQIMYSTANEDFGELNYFIPYPMFLGNQDAVLVSGELIQAMIIV